ncbi:MAG TPA: HU family DNA-binding protein [Methylomirabilota bacterium]|jgi:DNA-binding protein HU-beta|nr:HU family DNA-binding protein [Methylomirabilota bacterium]
MAKVMTKAATVGHLADKTGLTKKQVAGLMDELQSLAVKEAKRNGAFVLPGIGKVVLSNRKARMGRNPQTGEPIKIAAKRVVRIRAAKILKDAILGAKK